MDTALDFPISVPAGMNEDGSVSISFRYTLPTTPAARCDVTYTVYPCGTVDVRLGYDPVEGLSPMPEFGMLLKLDADYDRVRWYGLGPDENYVDRREGARLGIWEREVKDNVARYLVPQECGNRTGVRWADVTDYRGRGLRFMGEGEGMEFSALPYTPHELENAAHPYELPPVHYTVIRCALRQMGVGGDDSWGARTHDDFPGMELIRPMYRIRERDIVDWRDGSGLRFLRCACRFTESSGEGRADSKRQEIKALIAGLDAENPKVSANIFNSIHTVQLDTLVGWKQRGEAHSFLDDYDESDPC